MLRHFQIPLLAILSGFLLFGSPGWSKVRKPKKEKINYNDPNMGLHTNRSDQLSAFVELSIPPKNTDIPRNAIPDKILIPKTSTPEVEDLSKKPTKPQSQPSK